jgi:hypothetical protein
LQSLGSVDSIRYPDVGGAMRRREEWQMTASLRIALMAVALATKFRKSAASAVKHLKPLVRITATSHARQKICIQLFRK